MSVPCVRKFVTQSESYYHSAFTILQIGRNDALQRQERAEDMSKVPERVTLRRMCVVVCDGLCVSEHAYWSVYLNVAESETELHSGCRARMECPGRCRLDTAASLPPPGCLPYCRTGSCSGRSFPPACPHEGSRHCPDTPELPVYIKHTES